MQLGLIGLGRMGGNMKARLEAAGHQVVGFDRQDAVVVTVFRRPGGNTVQISRDVAALLEEKGLTLAPDDPRKKPPRRPFAQKLLQETPYDIDRQVRLRDSLGSAFGG